MCGVIFQGLGGFQHGVNYIMKINKSEIAPNGEFFKHKKSRPPKVEAPSPPHNASINFLPVIRKNKTRIDVII